ncbi:MAG: HupE/UreJ family protein, partial [Thermodesulfobacteriota bacterium]
IFHGHAHGTEMPIVSQPALYALGFVSGTSLIHILGVLIGVVSKKIPQGAMMLRFVGAGIAGIGFHLLLM